MGTTQQVEPPNNRELNLTIEETTTSAEREEEEQGQTDGDKTKEGSSYTTPLLISAAGLVLFAGASAPFVKKRIIDWRTKRKMNEEEGEL